MTIQYSITPNEVTQSYIQQLRFSAAFRTRILLYAGLVGLIYFLPKLFRQEVRIFDIIMTFLLMLGLVVFLPFVLRLFTKPQQRILTIDAQGIQTTIGEQSGTVPWPQVADIVQDGDFIFVIGRSGNSFLIPNRAFPAPEQRQAFLEAITKYRAAHVS